MVELQAGPETVIHPKVPRKPQARVYGDRTLACNDLPCDYP